MFKKLRLSKRWIMVGVILGSLIVGGGLAYGANSIIVNFSSDVGISGKVIIEAPDPTIDDLEIIVPTFTLQLGDTTAVQGYIEVKNKSKYDLMFVGNNFVIEMDNKDAGNIEGVFELQPFDYLLPKNGKQDIPIEFTPSITIIEGEYGYSGTIEYSY